MVKQLQERLFAKQEEARRLRDEATHLESKLSDAEAYIAAANRKMPVLSDKTQKQHRRLAALEDSIPASKERLFLAKQDHKISAVQLSHWKLEHALVSAEISTMALMSQSIENKKLDTRKQVQMLHSVAGMKRAASLPKMGEMISAVCDFNRKLRAKPRTQSASSRKERVPSSPKVTSSPLLTPRRLMGAPGLPLSARTTPKRIPRHKP